MFLSHLLLLPGGEQSLRPYLSWFSMCSDPHLRRPCPWLPVRHSSAQKLLIDKYCLETVHGPLDCYSGFSSMSTNLGLKCMWLSMRVGFKGTNYFSEVDWGATVRMEKGCIVTLIYQSMVHRVMECRLQCDATSFVCILFWLLVL